jgi:hypothetical protein
MPDAHAPRRAMPRPSLSIALNVLGLFGLFKKKEAAPPPKHVEVVPEAPPPRPAPAPRDPSIRDSVRFKGLHEDVNPSASVRPSEMTCVNCGKHFRFFVNSNGSKTLCSCPGCGRQYRI